MELPQGSKGRAKGGFDLHAVPDPGRQLGLDGWGGVPLVQEHYAGEVLLVPDGPAYGLVDSLHAQVLHQHLPGAGLAWGSGKCLVQVSHLLLQLWRHDVGVGHAHHDHTP